MVVSKVLIAALFMMGVVLLGCSSGPQVDILSGESDSMAKGDGSDAMVEKDSTAMEKDPNGVMEKSDAMIVDNSMEGKAMAKTAYEPFTVEKYEAARSDGKRIFLEFYANWCPTCKAQKPALAMAFSEINDPQLAAFEVNYNDSETEDAERNLARKFGVSYQHTHVLIDSGENKLKPNSNEMLTAAQIKEFVGV